MQTVASLDPQDIDREWADRCQLWLAKSQKLKRPRKRREREPSPIILSGQGVDLRVDKGCLVVRDGRTHHPQERREWRLFKGTHDLPQRIVVVDSKGGVTLDAIRWLSEQDIPLIALNWDGGVASVLSKTGYAADQEKVAWQYAARENEAERVAFAVPLILEKVRRTLWNLEHVLPESSFAEKAIATAEHALSQLDQSPPQSVLKLQALEGGVAQGYFYSWRALDMKWRALGKHPIPKEWMKFFARSSLNSSNAGVRNERASHPINAMLNYAYTMLVTHMKIKAISDGYDPIIGVFHDQRSKNHRLGPSFALDLMEPARPVVDRAVLELIKTETFSGSDFQLQSDGVVRMNPELARHVAHLTSQILSDLEAAA